MKFHVQRMSDTGGGSSGSNGNPVGPPDYPPPPPPPQAPAPAPQQPYMPPPAYAPPAPQGYGPPPMQQPGFAPAPAKSRGSRTLTIAGIIAAFLVIVLGGGGFLLNGSLSSTYNPGKAVTEYFAAQARGDGGYMWANANYLKGDGAQDTLFDKSAVAAMAAVKENQAVSGVTVTSTTQLDSSTDKVAVSMTWNGNQVSETYTVHKDTSRTHFLFYNDWKLDIPASTVAATLPNQPGAVSVDGIQVAGDSTAISVIQGYHTVTMNQTPFYDADNESVNALDQSATVAFKSDLSSSAQSAAADAIRTSFQPGNITCDVKSDSRCPNHLYTVPAGYYEALQLPGGEIDANKSWEFTITGDPTAGMKLVVGTTTGQIAASGTCTESLTVDGSKKYNFTGTWTGTLTWSGGSFGYDGTFGCDDSRV